jgi:poly [ADP-ribose] polymerase
MDNGLQKLISLIFDVNIMNNTMKEIGYDAKRMPLGKLGETTIKEAYGVLSKLSEAVKKKNKDDLTKLSSEFYTLIPHDFGFQKMANFILDNDEKVKEKIKMLETISDLKITSKLLDQKTDDNESVLDQNYKKLACSIKTLDSKSAEHKLL